MELHHQTPQPRLNVAIIVEGLLSHADTSSQGSLNNAGATVIQDVTLDTYGHVTALGPVTITPALIGAATSSHAHIIADVSGLQTTLNTKASVVYVDTAVASLVDTAPSTLDTLNELAAALGDDPNFATTVSNQIGTKLNATANAVSASKWQTARTIALAGDLSGSAALDGTSNITISATVADDSHNHTVANVDGLQAALDSKLAATGKAADSNLLDGNDSAHFYPASNPNGYTTNVGDITGINAGSGLTGGGAGGTVTLAHADTSTQASVNNSGATFIQDVTLDAYGHVTVLSSTTVTPATIGAQPAGTYNTVIGTDDDIDTSGSSIIGNIFVTDGVITSMGTRTLTAGDIGAYPASNPNGYTNNIGDITGVTAGSGLSGGGTSGTVTLNHADTSTQSSVNNSGSTYIQDISVDAYGHITSLGSATIPVASTTTAGLMATGDKTQLDALSAALGAAFTVQAVNATTFSSARLVFRHNGIAIMSLDTGGNLTLKGNVTAFGSV